jgi:flagellar basal-body rod protein FlgG
LNTSLYISSGAMQTFQQKIDTLANNVANVDTNGFKRKDHSFSEILASQINNLGSTNQEAGRLTPDGLRVSYGSRLGVTQVDMDQGKVVESGNPFDLMINGKGFFQVGYPSAGGTGEIHYTRDGNFHLSPNPTNPESFHLVNANGGYLLDQNGAPIELNGQDDVQIGETGLIQIKNRQGAPFISPQRVAIVDIQNPHVLKSLGGNEFAVDPAALTNGTTAADYIRMMAAGESQISSGYLEGSNVDLTEEMSDLIAVQRGFQMNARALSYADQMMGIANNILR